MAQRRKKPAESASAAIAAAPAPCPRCSWPRSEISLHYHDHEWGVPVHDERLLFEHVVLDGAQAGLSWEIILRKRARYREVFDNFDYTKIARYGPRKVEQLLGDAGIVRNRLKIQSAIDNAKAMLLLHEKGESLDGLLWQFVGGKPLINKWTSLRELPARTAESDAMSKALKQRGFRFVGSTICYAFMQAAGLVNDHLVTCFRYRELGGKAG